MEPMEPPGYSAPSRQLSLWDFLTLMAASGPLGGVWAAAKAAHLVGWGFATALALGLLLGLGSSYLVWVCGERTTAHLESEIASGQALSVRTAWTIKAAYAGKFLWFPASGVLAYKVTSALFHWIVGG